MNRLLFVNKYILFAQGMIDLNADLRYTNLYYTFISRIKSIRGNMSTKITYKDAGVDIDTANEFIDRIKPLIKTTARKEVISGIGGFGGLFHFNSSNLKNPVLVSSKPDISEKSALNSVSQGLIIDAKLIENRGLWITEPDDSGNEFLVYEFKVFGRGPDFTKRIPGIFPFYYPPKWFEFTRFQYPSNYYVLVDAHTGNIVGFTF